MPFLLSQGLAYYFQKGLQLCSKLYFSSSVKHSAWRFFVLNSDGSCVFPSVALLHYSIEEPFSTSSVGKLTS